MRQSQEATTDPQIALVGQSGTACLRSVCDRRVEKDQARGLADHTPALCGFVNPQASLDLCQRLCWVTKKARGTSWCAAFKEPSAGHLQPPLSLCILANMSPMLRTGSTENQFHSKPQI